MTPLETNALRAALYTADGSSLLPCTRYAEHAGLRIVTMLGENDCGADMGGARLNRLVDRLCKGEFEIIVADAGAGRLVNIFAVPAEEPDPRCAVYLRSATPSQATPYPLADQWEACEAYAKERGWETVAVYRDDAVSGVSPSRPNLDAMMADAERGAFDVLLVKDLDRLSRSAVQLHDLLERLDALGIAVHAASGDGLAIATRAAAIQFVCGACAEDTLQVGPAGRVAYGYKQAREGKSGQREVDPAQARVVQGIFAACAEDLSPQKIAEALNGGGLS